MPEVNDGTIEKLVIGDDVFVPLLTEDVIQNRIKELAVQISQDYKEKIPIFIGVLNGAFIFLSDLIKNISINCEIDFFKLSSYGDSKISSGNVKLLKELNCDVNGRDIIIVEDIVDSGLSIKYIEEIFAKHKPKSIKVCALLMKPDSLKYNVKIDYIGFNIPSKFVIGYGLDYSQKFRNLRTIFYLSE
ncbi:MAG: hypoxanthine phosphoribosyltransferase [Ignavibacteriaceae bacterium]|nr:hypoxanthine phosphoribosyltransferase [Ignavibacterium sp.]MCC6254386.1 hypoxanthine phosphoribosyltransferase [Ignavibacteriaceae bacterium]HRN26970.1 hypoxanthine phosphoribosyltransferase [Ignavibacteriaceae bacterium]HRP93401.1 hypoxanthine phosphoribosyltransferase [Ignavibacteriaceae bacterium]HRQ54542.1 hypoxanthine phosphoribosyltransferase [Ignavibacteriaceae bacterium]